MTKVHPNTTVVNESEPRKIDVDNQNDPTVLTVWLKSLLFNCSGFTVFDSKGNLVFRVDSYESRNKAEFVLMDATGKPMLSIRRKLLSLSENWLIYNGEDSVKPLFSVKKHVSFHHSKVLAHVTPCRGSRADNNYFQIEGSYDQHNCAVYDDRRRVVAEIRRKESAAHGAASFSDVFHLVVQSELDTSLAMALVIAVDHMCRSRVSR